MEGFIKMLWSDVEKKYGKETAKKMSKSQYLRGITLLFTEDGKTDFPETDIRLAYKDVTHLPIHPLEWD